MEAGYPIIKTYPPKCKTPDGQIFVQEAGVEVPYYFIAIHNEPLPDPLYPGMTIESSYITLKEIIAKADSYNMKLTLMLSPPWVDYIMSHPDRLASLESWKENGHEISTHHHAVTHALWDGYTNTPQNEAIEIREKIRKDRIPEIYYGTMNDFMDKMQIINPNLNSGCLNGDMDPTILPDEILCSTCSGKANMGEPGRRLLDGDPTKGINEYISTFTVNGITRRYLTHAQVTNEVLRRQAEEIYASLNHNLVYGVVAHSIEANTATGNLDEAETIMRFMDYLHEKDPTGERSKTLSEIIEEQLLPEKEISEHTGNKCGDNICDSVEEANPELCPQDCESSATDYSEISTSGLPLGMHGGGARPQNMTHDALFDYDNALDLGIAWDRPFFQSSDYPFDQQAQALSDAIFAQVPPNLQKVLNIYSPREHGSMKLRISDQEFYDYVIQIVERYDGDGIDDMPGLTSPVKYWQIDNEAPGYLFLNVDGMEPLYGDEYIEQLQENWGHYAHTLEIADRAIKAACADCKTMMSSIAYGPLHHTDHFKKAHDLEDRSDIVTLRYFYVPVLEQLNGQHVDIFDFHLYGDYTDAKLLYDEVKSVLQQTNFDDTEVWITEVGNAGAYAFETKQANALPKLMIYPIVHGIEKVFWFNMVDVQNKPPMGLVHDGKKDKELEDPGYGVKKSSYYTYKFLIDKLGDTDWNNIETIKESDGIYVYKFILSSGEPIWVAWSDAGGSVTLTGINADNVQITEAVPKYETGQQVTDFNTAFETRIEPINQGEVTTTLDETPIFIEE